MNIIEQAKLLISNDEIKDASKNMLEDAINAILGDPVSTGKIIISILKSPFFIREQLFWTKLECYLNGTYLNEDDCAKLCAKLAEDGEKRNNARRLLESIDRAETHRKVQYLINATRCFLIGFIDKPTFFRICHAITNTLEEDLLFLSEHIGESDIFYSEYTQGLKTSGLMYESVISSNGESQYSFTPLAEMVDQYAVSYSNIERYPNPIGPNHNVSIPQTKLSGIPEMEEISIEEINNMFQK